jgi:hypothetical protein
MFFWLQSPQLWPVASCVLFLSLMTSFLWLGGGCLCYGPFAIFQGPDNQMAHELRVRHPAESFVLAKLDYALFKFGRDCY